jgi:predicted deacylase
MDAALVGRTDAARTIVLLSGTHGAEGFAGSAIQTGLLKEKVSDRLSRDVNLLMIHGVNPYGMAHLRRCTEDNVDLNRNFRDHDAPYPENRRYEELSKALTPSKLSCWSELVSWVQIWFYRFAAGRAAAQAAISGGQHSHPEGLFYGGNSNTWSNTTLLAIIQRHLSKTKKAIFIDLHTGLGDFGNAEIILHVPRDSDEYKRACSIWDPSMVKTTATGEAASVHLDTSLSSALPCILPGVEITAVTLELGTVPIMRVLKVLRRENWLHQNGGWKHPRAQKLKSDLLRAFYPDSKDWKDSAWQMGTRVFDQALKRSIASGQPANRAR